MPSEEGKLEEIRNKIDEIDAAIVDLLSQRMYYAKEAKEEKVRLKMPIEDRQREKEVVEKWCKRARRRRNGSGRDGSAEHELSEEMMVKMAEFIIEYTVKKELEEEQ
jgi:chorismate mutase